MIFEKDYFKAKMLSISMGLTIFELWLITPTKPFHTEEIQRIRSWVAKGGRLVVIY